jgi:hypothetical protein
MHHRALRYTDIFIFVFGFVSAKGVTKRRSFHPGIGFSNTQKGVGL